MFMFLASLGCLHIETSFLLLPYPSDWITSLLVVGAGIMPELGTGGNTVKQPKREGGVLLTFLPVKASSNWPNALYIHTWCLHTGWKGQPLISLCCLIAFPARYYLCWQIPSFLSMRTVIWSLRPCSRLLRLILQFAFISGCYVIAVAGILYVQLSIIVSLNCSSSIFKNKYK